VLIPKKYFGAKKLHRRNKTVNILIVIKSLGRLMFKKRQTKRKKQRGIVITPKYDSFQNNRDLIGFSVCAAKKLKNPHKLTLKVSANQGVFMSLFFPLT